MYARNFKTTYVASAPVAVSTAAAQVLEGAGRVCLPVWQCVILCIYCVHHITASLGDIRSPSHKCAFLCIAHHTVHLIKALSTIMWITDQAAETLSGLVFNCLVVAACQRYPLHYVWLVAHSNHLDSVAECHLCVSPCRLLLLTKLLQSYKPCQD